MVHYTSNSKYEVLTPDGFKDFNGITEEYKDNLTKIYLSNNSSIVCTYDHQIQLYDGEWIMAISAFVDDVITTRNGSLSIINIEHHIKGECVYDLIGVIDVECYYTNEILSHNCSVVYVDEACFIEKDMEFFASTYPVITSGKDTRIIMTTTPRGARGMFYMLWKDALEKKNTFIPYQADWTSRPERDEKWKEETIANIGYSRFAQEFCNSWQGSTGTLIPMKVLETLQWMNPIQEDEFMLIYNHYDPTRKYITVADPSEGLGQDYSVATVIDVTAYPYKIVAKYRNNNISPLLFPHTIMNICMSYGSCPALVESNNACGGQVTYILYYELEYENMVLTSNSEKAIGGLREGGKSNQALPGVKTSKKVKSIGCSNLKTLMENEYLVIEDRDTIEELGTFIAKGTSYEADDECHDDTIMPLVLFSWFVKSEHFSEYCGNNIGIDLYQRNLDRAMESVMPFGVIHNNYIDDPEKITHNNYSNGNFFDVTENMSKSFAQWMME